MESALSSFNICPFHRSELGIGWRRNSYSSSCQVPQKSTNHIIERRGKPVKADKRVRGRTFQNIMIYQQTGILIPVGSATLGLFTVLYSNKSLRFNPRILYRVYYSCQLCQITQSLPGTVPIHLICPIK